MRTPLQYLQLHERLRKDYADVDAMTLLVNTIKGEIANDIVSRREGITILEWDLFKWDEGWAASMERQPGTVKPKRRNMIRKLGN